MVYYLKDLIKGEYAMICNKCGAKNRDIRTKCFNCGASFVGGGVVDEKFNDYPDDIGMFTSPKPRKKAPVVEQNEFTVENIYTDNEYVEDEIEETEEFVDEVDTFQDEPELQFTPIVKADEPASELDLDENYDEYDNDLYADTDDVPPEIMELSVDEETEQYFKVAKKKKSSSFTVIIWLLSLLFVIIAIIVGVLIYTMVTEDDGTSVDPTVDTIADLNIDAPQISKLKDDKGIEYIHAVFKGVPGDRILLKCNNTYHTFIEETLEIDLYLEDLFNSEYEFRSSTVEANMFAYYIRNKKEYSCGAPAFTMSVPEAQLDLELLAQEIQVYKDSYTLKFWTSTDATVQLNNKNITSNMDGMGNFAYNITVNEDSTATYYLSVSQPYHTPKSEVFILSRDNLPVTLTIASTVNEPQSSNVLVLRCQTEPDTAITANLPILEMNKNELYNTCELKLDLSDCEYGEIEVLISATNEKGTSTKAHTVKYWPDENKITTTASKFNSAVAANPKSYTGRNYVINSVKAVKTISSKKFEAVCVLNDLEYTLIIENENVTTNILKDSSYKIFAQCTGETENGAPVFKAWYIYKA